MHRQLAAGSRELPFNMSLGEEESRSTSMHPGFIGA